jgi:hypothetical protein
MLAPMQPTLLDAIEPADAHRRHRDEREQTERHIDNHLASFGHGRNGTGTFTW